MDLDLKNYKNKRICVAVSGGVDSMVLLYVLKANEKKYSYTLLAVNFEHGIRGEESKADSKFVIDTCAALDIPMYAFSENCIEKAKREKLSLETAARNFRKEYYERLLSEGVADFIATAHHANDEAETVLFRLARGSALTGASGIKRTNGKYIRPLIEKTKQEIVAYATEKKIPFREDLTNGERIATRNVIRLDVLPKLEEVISGTTKNLSRFASLAAEDDEFLYELSASLITLKKDTITVSFSEKKPLFTRACLTAMKSLGVDKDYSFVHLDDLFELQKLRIGAKLSLPKEVFAKKTVDGITFYKDKSLDGLEFQSIPFQLGEFWLGNYQVTVSLTPLTATGGEKILRLDKDELPDTCVIRQRKEGDIFQKYGGGNKTLKRYLIDKKIPVEKRDMPLLADENGVTVYAVFGVEISERVKITDKTKTIVYLTIKDKRS